jgi:hypothetical protein
MLLAEMARVNERYYALDRKYGLVERLALPADFTFPVGTWRRYEQWWDGTHGDRREWTLGGREYSVSFWFRPPTDSDRAEGCVIAGIESHAHAHEDHRTTPCRNSPTGFCHHDGTSLGGVDLYHAAAYPNDIMDEARIWRKLVAWYTENVGREDYQDA